MATSLGAFDPQALVVLVVALVGAVPVVLYYQRTNRWFVVAYAALLVAAVATNVENIVLPTVLNATEHVLGNMAAGIAFALAAYVYRQRRIVTDADQPDSTEA